MRGKLWLAGAVGLAAAVQSVAVTREFLSDDYLHLYQLATLDFWRFLLQTYTGHILITFNAVLALLHGVFGLDAVDYYLVVLATHTANIALLWIILRRYVTPARAAIFAGLWGVAPVHQGALSWFSVYPYVLCTMFVLLACALLGHYFALRRRPPGWALGISVALLILAATSFAVGIAVAFVFPGIAWLLAPPESGRGRVALALSPLALVPVFYLLVSQFVDASAGRSDLAASVGLFARFLGYGTGLLTLGPFFTVTAGHTAGWPMTSLRMDQIVPLGYPLAIVFGALLAWTLRLADAGTRRMILAGLLLFVTAYGIIALGRVPPPFVSLSWIASSPRYHYLPLAAAALTLGVASSVWDRAAWSDNRRRIARITVGVYVAAVVVGSYLVARQMPNSLLAMMQVHAALQREQFVEEIHRSPPGSQVFIENAAFDPVMFVMHVAGKSPQFPGLAAYFAILYGRNTVDGRTVRFVERDARLVREVREGPSPRMGELLVTEAEAAAAGADLHWIPSRQAPTGK